MGENDYFEHAVERFMLILVQLQTHSNWTNSYTLKKAPHVSHTPLLAL